ISGQRLSIPSLRDRGRAELHTRCIGVGMETKPLIAACVDVVLPRAAISSKQPELSAHQSPPGTCTRHLACARDAEACSSGTCRFAVLPSALSLGTVARATQRAQQSHWFTRVQLDEGGLGQLGWSLRAVGAGNSVIRGNLP